MRDQGQARERITIEAPTTTQDATGGAVTTWAPIAHGGGTLWARKLSEKGLERFAGARHLATAEVAFAVRYWPAHGLSALNRFQWAGKVWNVISVVETEHRAELVLVGTSGSNRG